MKSYYTSQAMRDREFEGISRADKRAMRDKIDAMMQDYRAKAGKVKRVEKREFSETMQRAAKSWCGTGEKKAPTRPEDVYSMPRSGK